MTTDQTIRDIVANDYRAAAVFERHGIDFCCGGDRTVEAACTAKGLAPASIVEELEAATAAPGIGTPQFNEWDLPSLTSYIVANHHGYVRRAIPDLLQHTRKISAVHGEHHPELAQVAHIFEGVADEMLMHMMKEERMLFPYIDAMARAASAGQPVPVAPFGTVQNPIRMMEMEHESAGTAMARINELTRGYQPPDDACTTYKVCLQELDAFERDLHAHVHLENNILFPRAAQLEG